MTIATQAAKRLGEDPVVEILKMPDKMPDAVVADAAFHLPGEHDQHTHGAKETISSADQAKFGKRLAGAKSGDKARKATASSDDYTASGPGGYGEHHKNTVVTPSQVGDWQAEGQVLTAQLRAGNIPEGPNSEGWTTTSHTALTGMDAMQRHPKSVLRDDIAVERGISDPHKVFGDAWQSEGSNVGLTWRDRAFVATTHDHSVVHHFTGGEGSGVRMRILVPKGTRAVAIGSHGTRPDYAWEREIVLDRGQRYRIMADHGLVDGVRTVDVEVLGP